MTKHDDLIKQDEQIRNNDKISYDELVTYQRKMAKEYPFFPLEEKDWNIVKRYNISVKGLEQLEILRRQTILGKSAPEEITLMVSLMELYASTNPSKKNIQNWKKHLDFHFDILLKTHYNPDLVKEGLTVINEKYSEKKFLEFMKWGDDLIQRCYRLKKLGENKKNNDD